MDNVKNKYEHLLGTTNFPKLEIKGEEEALKKATFNNRTIQSQIRDERDNSINAEDK